MINKMVVGKMSFFLRELHTSEANINNWFLESVKIKSYWNKDRRVKCMKYIRVIALHVFLNHC